MQNVECRISESESKIENRQSKIENSLVLVLDTAGAAYPITVDPVIYGSEIKLTASDGAAGDNFGIAVSVAGDVAVVGAYYKSSNRGAAYVFERNAGGTNVWGQVAKLTAPEPASYDYFGCSVSVAGDVAIVGAYGKDTALGNNAGEAYIFERNAGGTNTWGQVTKLTASDGAENDFFGVSVSVAGDVAIVGTYGKNSFAGAAYVFERNADGTNAWSQVKKLTASDGAADDLFGNSVSVAGDVAVVGASSKDSYTGAAYVFERNAGGTNTWGQVAELTASDGAEYDYFGWSVSVDGDVVAVGVSRGEGLVGAAYVFERNAGGTNAWGQVIKLTASDAAEGDRFGSSVSVAGGFAVVGAYNASAGAAYVFKRTKGGSDVWGQVAKFTASDGAEYDYFGWSVSVAGDVVVVGAYNKNSAAGAAYVYPVSQTTKDFNQIARKTPSDGPGDYSFGYSVSVAGDTAIVGAYSHTTYAGAAYLFERNAGGTNAWGQVAKLTASDSASYDKFGIAVAMAGDVAVVGADYKSSGVGAAYVFERNAGGTNTWGQVAKLTASDSAADDRFGNSVSVAGDVAIVGAHHKSSGAGAAYVYERDAGGTNAWGQVKKLAGEGGYFGTSVSMAGDVIVVGAYSMYVAPYNSAGAAYVYERDAGGTNAWGQVKRLTASDTASYSYFGSSVSVAGDTAIVGADGKDSYTGAAYVFERSVGGTNAWGEVVKLTASDSAMTNYFGCSVSVAGGVAVVGAYGKNSNAGAAYVYERNAGGTNAWGQTLKLTASDASAYSYFGIVSVAGDVIAVGAYTRSAFYVFEDTLLPSMQVLGTNGAVIASGEEASAAKGTDFGSVSNGVVLTNTFSITNSGAENLFISGLTTNGVHASAFSVQPSTFTIAASNSANFTVRFAPTNPATYTAAVAMVNSASTSSYVICLSGTVPRLSQTITFPTIADQVVTSTVRLSATASSGLAVTFTNVSGSPVSWQNATTITFTATGTVRVVARQWGNATYEAAPNVTNTFSVLSEPVPAGDGWLAVSVTPTSGSWTIDAPAGYTGPTSGTGNLAAVSAVTGEYAITWGALSGYYSPSNQSQLVIGGSTSIFAGVYTVAPSGNGSLAAVILPAEVVAAGAMWRVDGGAWQVSGAIVTGLTAGSHTVNYSEVAGYTNPVDQAVTISPNQLSAVQGTYRLVSGDEAYDPICADYDGDKIADPAICQPASGLWLARFSGIGYQWGRMTRAFGPGGYAPLAADFDGDAKADPGLYNTTNGEWRAMFSTADYTEYFLANLLGDAGSTAMAADFDGDRLADPAVYNPATGDWKARLSSGGYLTFTAANLLGRTGFAAAAGDMDGDRLADPFVCDMATGQCMALLSSLEYARFETAEGFLGAPQWLLALADYDGDGKADPAIYDPETGTLIVRLSRAGYVAAVMPEFLKP